MTLTSEPEKLFLMLGALLLALGVVLNEWLLALIFSSDGQIDLSARIVIRVFDVSMILIGLFFILFRSKIDFNFNQSGNSLRKILIAGILLRIVVYIFLQPNNNDPHLEVIEFIVNNGRLPTSNQFVTSFHPPLYYLMAAPLAMIGPAKVVQLLSLVFSVGNLFLLYYLVKSTRLLRSASAKSHALLLAALLPQLVLFGSFISNDTLSFFIGSLLFIQVFRYIERSSVGNLALLGFILGVGLLTKGSFLAFLPVLLGVVVVMGLRHKISLRKHAQAVAVFCAITAVVGSYKFVANTIHLGKPILTSEDLKNDPKWRWIGRQGGTYQGLKSFLDFNVIKLVRHPFLSDYTKHSYPLLLYSTFWYSHIKESNFNATRDYPHSLLPRAIYFIGLAPTLLMVLGAGSYLWRNRWPITIARGSEDEFRLQMCEAVILLVLLLNFALVFSWGFKHDAWSFFQARLLFPAFFSIMILFGLGYEILVSWRENTRSTLNFLLFFLYGLFGLYFVTEIGYIVERRLTNL
ncbi:hypothetical protein GWO43_14640 [candidate division KSB1 bacterium]|nr:hypothetical protein [candidate division KSB1 bacterium]NIR72962.1 hypothetical protein [candidate division KSB1 bacterium]NIS25179.1 hypothetical protein [candidate division KSB1 bacterium]NIT72082.1 hypothetical protein [candidate division KSB1 bacterium]NIU25882.1 hypothetical protein [candidate division KSB1 bacterium]